MTIEVLKEFLFYCLVINIAFLLYWFLMISFFKNFVYKLHSKWFKIPQESFDEIHYKAIAYYKLMVITFVLVPYLSLLIIS